MVKKKKSTFVHRELGLVKMEVRGGPGRKKALRVGYETLMVEVRTCNRSFCFR
jgi:hypothetical protein